MDVEQIAGPPRSSRQSTVIDLTGPDDSSEVSDAEWSMATGQNSRLQSLHNLHGELRAQNDQGSRSQQRLSARNSNNYRPHSTRRSQQVIDLENPDTATGFARTNPQQHRRHPRGNEGPVTVDDGESSDVEIMHWHQREPDPEQDFDIFTGAPSPPPAHNNNSDNTSASANQDLFGRVTSFGYNTGALPPSIRDLFPRSYRNPDSESLYQPPRVPTFLTRELCSTNPQDIQS